MLLLDSRGHAKFQPILMRDRTVPEPARLAILVPLSMVKSADLQFLEELLGYS